MIDPKSLSASALDAAYAQAVKTGDQLAALAYADEIISRTSSFWGALQGAAGINRFPLYSALVGVSQTSIQGDLATSAHKVGQTIANDTKSILGKLSIGAGAIFAVVILFGLGYIWLTTRRK